MIRTGLSGWMARGLSCVADWLTRRGSQAVERQPGIASVFHHPDTSRTVTPPWLVWIMRDRPHSWFPLVQPLDLGRHRQVGGVKGLQGSTCLNPAHLTDPKAAPIGQKVDFTTLTILSESLPNITGRYQALCKVALIWGECQHWGLWGRTLSPCTFPSEDTRSKKMLFFPE